MPMCRKYVDGIAYIFLQLARREQLVVPWSVGVLQRHKQLLPPAIAVV